MDVAVSRRNQSSKKGNKENAQPAHGSKSFIRRDKPSVAPFHVKSNDKAETQAKPGPLKATTKPASTRPTSVNPLKKPTTVQRDGKVAAGLDVAKRQTHSQVFLTQQAVKQRKMVAEPPKPPPAAVPPPKSAPGMYKGKIIQSKIGSIWKSSASVDHADPKPSTLKTASKSAGNMAKSRSKSVADLPGPGTRRPEPARSNTVFSRPAPVSKPVVTSRPPARSVPATLTSTSSRNATVVLTKRSGTESSKPKMSATDKKVNKPSVTSTLSQYRFSMETTEERRAKLAAWQASKGKTVKRPAMSVAAPPKTKVSQPAVAQPQPAARCEPEPSLETHQSNSAAAAAAAASCADTQGADVTAKEQTPMIAATTLELLDNTDELSVDPEGSVDDIVVNLCEVLEAMATPSRCSDELSRASDEVELDERTEAKVEPDESGDAGVEEGQLKEECEREENEIPQAEQVKEEAEKCELEVTQTDDEDVDDDDDDDAVTVESDDEEDGRPTTPQMEDASVVKYSVKTTPYLQSVKKTLGGDVSASASGRKSGIKDLKYLTPVRRSCRIQRKSSVLPTMLADHDPCVSSLAELVKLDEDPNAYIYRKNPALLQELPDRP